MKSNPRVSNLTLCFATLLTALGSVFAGSPIEITSLENNGQLTWAGPSVGAACQVEWASTASGPWHKDWDSLSRVAVTGATTTVQVPRFFRVISLPASIGELNFIPGGSFTMGSATLGGWSAPEHTVTLSPFYLSKYETSYALWYSVKSWAATNGYFFANAGREGDNGVDGAAPVPGKNEPVGLVNWRDTVVWCNARSEMEGYTPAYKNGLGTAIRDSRDSNATEVDSVVLHLEANGYRLPTEAEWEYAARYVDGTTFLPGNFASGASANNANSAANSEVAWYSFNSLNVTHAIGLKKANALGLHDMSGNVWEFTWDRWDPPYPSTQQTNPLGPSTGSSRTRRGGSRGNVAANIVVSDRAYVNYPYDEATELGFRCAKGL